MKKPEKKRMRLEEIINNIKYDAESYHIKDLTDNDITELATGICDELESDLLSEEELGKLIVKEIFKESQTMSVDKEGDAVIIIKQKDFSVNNLVKTISKKLGI